MEWATTSSFAERIVRVSLAGILLLACSNSDKPDGAGQVGAPGAPKEGGASDGGVALTAKCVADDLLPPAPAGTGLGKACSSYVTPTSDGEGVITEFGRYGALVEGNTGAAFAVTPNSADTAASCQSIASSFGEDPNLTSGVLDLRGADLSLYTVFRPANWVDGEKYPVITWGNGTCAYPGSYAALLGHVASHGFVVVASNGRFVANGAQKNALDFVFSANDDSSSLLEDRDEGRSDALSELLEIELRLVVGLAGLQHLTRDTLSQLQRRVCSSE
jgi:hypothetical protein